MDHISISLNASNPRSYQELCSSEFGEKAHQAIIDFAIECLKYIPQVTLSVVDVIPGEEIEKCREIAEKAGTSFRVRHMQD